MESLFSRKELIYTVYREKSISKAAQKLFIAQPSLSLMVKKIEDQVGVPLFDRTTKPIRLTEAGQEYITAVEQIRHVEASFENYIQAAKDLQAGSLGIGSNQLLSSLVLPKYIARFAQRYPGIKLRLLDANSTTLANAITAGELDIIIDNHILPDELFEKKHLVTEHLLLAVPAEFSENEAARPYQLTYYDILNQKHLDAGLSPVPLHIFTDVPFILMNRDNDTRKQTTSLFQSADFNPKVIMELDRLMTLYSYIEQGLGASIVSDTLVRNIRSGGNILFYPLPAKNARREIFVSYKRNKYYSRAMAVFIESLEGLQ